MTQNKLFMCMPNFSGGGAEKVMLMLIREFSQYDRVSCIVLQATGPLQNQLPKNCHFENLNINSARKSILKLATLFRKEKPDIICSTLAYFNLTIMIALKISGHRPHRIILREANSPSATIMSLPAKWIGKLGYKYFYNRADAIICNAEHVNKELIQFGVRPELISIIPNPIDEKQIRQLAKKKFILPAFAEPDLPLLVAVGRLTRQKGMDRLITWINAVKTKSNLLIIGDGPNYDSLIDQIKKNNLEGRIKIINYQDNPFPFIAASQALLMGSRWEGLPNIALEALAIGKTVIATKNSGGLIELKKNIAENALIIADTDADFIAAVDRFTKNLNFSKSKGNSLSASLLPDYFYSSEVIKQYHSLIFGC